MPMYTVSSHSPLPSDTREEIANLIMNVHCRLTGAPETFVNVVFSHNVPHRRGVKMNIFGNVRKGRTPEMNRQLVDALREEILASTKYPSRSLELTLFEVPASWVMEGGEVLPEPGEEESCEWLNTAED